MKTQVRKSVPNDVYGIHEVTKITWLKTYPNIEEGITVEDIKEKFKMDETSEGKNNINTWVAEDKDKIIGFCMAIKEGKNNRVGAIYVIPSFQREGLGKQLIERAFDWLGDGKDILINVARYNKQAINFYEKLGFVKTGKSGALDSAAKLPSGKFIPEIELVKNCLGR